jgi:GrpB protein
VCPANSFELRRHLVFRDALRAQDKLRQEYEQRKLEIVERSGGDRKVYAEIKEIECRDFIESVVTRNPDDTKPANLYWLVMEYVEGTTLRQLLEEGTGSITERPTLDSDV